MHKSAFLKSSLLYSIGIFGSKVVLFVLIPIYSFFLSKDELGEYDLLLVSITFLTPLITIQISEAVYRFLLQDKENSQQIITTGLKLLFIGYLVFFTLFMFVNVFIEYEYFFEFVLLQMSSCLFVFSQQVLRGMGKNTLYAFMGIANAVLVTTFSAIVLLILNMKVGGILLALFIAQTITILCVFIFGKIYKEIELSSYDKTTAKSMVKYSWPLLPNAISWWLIDLGNRYIILFFLNEEYNGIYAISARYAGIIALVNSIFILSWQDFTISNQGKEKLKKQNASKILNRFIAFEMTAIIVLTASSRFLIKYTTDQEYHQASNYLPILFLSAGMSAFCAFYGAFYLKSKETKGILTTTFIGGLINIFISMVLINQFQLYAVAFGSVIGFISTLLLRMYKFKLYINYKLFGFFLFAYTIVLILQYFDSFFISILLVVLSMMLFFFVNRKLIVSVLLKFKGD